MFDKLQDPVFLKRLGEFDLSAFSEWFKHASAMVKADHPDAENGFFIMSDKYAVSCDRFADGWLDFRTKGYKDPRDGWKIHISVDAPNYSYGATGRGPAHAAADFPAAEENANRASRVIANFLKENEVKVFKVLNSEVYRGAIMDSYGGKFGVIYDPGKLTWEELLNGLHAELTKHGIKPGPQVADEMQVKGSNFFYYRNEQALDGSYLSHGSAIEMHGEDPVKYPSIHNPFNRPDPFATMDLSASVKPQDTSLKVPTLNMKAPDIVNVTTDTKELSSSGEAAHIPKSGNARNWIIGGAVAAVVAVGAWMLAAQNDRKSRGEAMVR